MKHPSSLLEVWWELNAQSLDARLELRDGGDLSELIQGLSSCA